MSVSKGTAWICSLAVNYEKCDVWDLSCVYCDLCKHRGFVWLIIGKTQGVRRYHFPSHDISCSHFFDRTLAKPQTPTVVVSCFSISERLQDSFTHGRVRAMDIKRKQNIDVGVVRGEYSDRGPF